MRLVDANILLYAVNSDSAKHDAARRWLDEMLAGNDRVGFAWSVLLAFLRLTTKAALFERPLSVEKALDTIDAWLAQPPAVIVHPTPRHAQILRGLVVRAGTGGNLTSDAHLAALAIEHGADLCSCDGDFRRFPGVRWHDPLE
jgi:toxin-antitoxin system PIN domain toxin